MWEREAALTAISVLLERARTGAGHSLFIVGEAGLGKTTILDHVGRLAQGYHLGHSRGDPFETRLPFGLLAQVMDGLGGKELLDQAFSEPWAAEIRTRQFYRVLRWLQDVAAEPLVIAMDDLHWGDTDSLALLSFLCRRVRSLPVAIVGTLRPWPRQALEVALSLSGGGFASVEHLAPLSEAATGTLLTARVGHSVPDHLVHQAWELCAGNPLLLEQAALTIIREEGLGQPSQHGQADTLDWLLLPRFANLPAAVMRYAQAASVLGIHYRPELAAEVSRLEDGEIDRALETLARSGLVRDAPGAGVEFVHPLLQQALYNDLGTALRTRLHTLAFAALARVRLDSEAAEHAIRAELVGNAQAVELLERAGRAALRSGAVGTAKMCLATAVRYAQEDPPPGLLMALAETSFANSDLADALQLYERVLAIPGLPAPLRAEALRMSGRTLDRAGAHAEAAARLDRAATLVPVDDPASAIRALISQAYAVLTQAGPAGAVPMVAKARGTAESARETQRPLLQQVAAAMWGYFTLLTGDASGLGSCLQVTKETAPRWGSQGDLDLTLRLLVCCASASYLSERFAEAEQAFTMATAVAGRAGATEGTGHALHLVHARTLARVGRLAEALSHAELACEEAQQAPAQESAAHLVRAEVLLMMGRGQDSAADCERGEAAARIRGEHLSTLGLWSVRARRYRHEGALTEACALFDRIEQLNGQLGIGEPCLFPWARDAVAAYVACDHIADAQRIVEWLDRCSKRLPCRWPGIAAAVGRAALAGRIGNIEAATTNFRAALRLHEAVDLPLERAQTLIEYGSFLRRTGRSVDARPYLAEAGAIAKRAGATLLTTRAVSELLVAGGRRRNQRDPEHLTPQELRVARLAAAGRGNREIARQLYLSIKTVETHLQQVYAKRRIHSRRQLMAMADLTDLENTAVLD